jgi:hypothetical protein
VDQAAEVESESAIVRFRAAEGVAPEVAAHSPAAVPVGAQQVPAVRGALPAWAEGAEVFAVVVEGGDSLKDTLTEKTRSDL